MEVRTILDKVNRLPTVLRKNIIPRPRTIPALQFRHHNGLSFLHFSYHIFTALHDAICQHDKLNTRNWLTDCIGDMMSIVVIYFNKVAFITPEK